MTADFGHFIKVPNHGNLSLEKVPQRERHICADPDRVKAGQVGSLSNGGAACSCPQSRVITSPYELDFAVEGGNASLNPYGLSRQPE
jgi:hypothetical protein